METQNNKTTTPQKEKTGGHFGGGRTLGGIIVVVVGTLWLAREVGVEFPYWLFSWPMFLIALGLYIGARHSFRQWGWLIPVAIGTMFLVDDLIPEINIGEFAWPITVICIGLFMIFRPRGGSNEFFKRWENKASHTKESSENMFESVTIFGEHKQQVLSKDFKGGESVCVFGGTEINLSQADITGRVAIEIVQVFGGTKLIVPGHWKIETEELVCILGGLNDKRQTLNSVIDQNKVLVLKGTCIFGGIDIRSF
jgi:predicted membrane protein